MFEHRVNEAFNFFSGIDGIYVSRPQGAFYMSVLFEDDLLNDNQTLAIENPGIREAIEKQVAYVASDKRFVYYLLGATGICVVPLTGFCCDRKGFRITLLETDDEKRIQTWETIADSIKSYLGSA
jgi:aspartate/methionine/tyrosine aminotransferase